MKNNSNPSKFVAIESQRRQILFLGLALFIAAFNSSVVSADSTNDVEILNWVQDYCHKGDPLCVEKAMVEYTTQKPTGKGTLVPAKKISVPPQLNAAETKKVTAPVIRLSESGRAASGIHVKTTAQGGALYEFDEDGIDGKGLKVNSIRGFEQRPAKIILSDELECQLPKEVTDQYQFDRSRCDQLQIKKVIEAGKDLSSKLAAEFAESMECPKDTVDIDKLRLLSEEYDRHPFQVDVSELINIPIDVSSPSPEAHLPVTCGYNNSYRGWFKTSFFCTDENTCFLQGDQSARKDDLRFSPFAQNLWRPTDSKRGFKSYREGGTIGDMRLVPLGNGVFIDNFRNNDNGVFSYGLIIVPNKATYQRQACKKYRWLAQNQELLKKSEIKEARMAIRKLLMQGEVLVKVKTLVQRIGASRDELSSNALERLNQKARDLLQVIEGKQDLPDFKVEQFSCPNEIR